MPRCSIVIPVFNKAALTRECLDRLLAAPETRDEELIVVDDCSQDETPALLAGYGDKIRVIRHAVNMGYGQGVNDGTAMAACEYVVHLNNDTVPVSGWLDALLRYADAHPRAGAVSSKLLNADGSVQHAGIVFDAGFRPWHLYRWFPADHPAVHKSRRFQAVTGTALLVRRTAFDRAGGFDATMRNSYNDVDFCLRLGEAGYESHLAHESVLYHLEGASKGPKPSDAENIRRFVERWRGRVRADEWDYYTEDGLVRVERASDLLEFVVDPVLGRARATELEAVNAVMLKQSQQIAALLREYIHLRLSTAAPGAAVFAPPTHRPDYGSPRQQRRALARLARLAERVLHDEVRHEYERERDHLLQKLQWLRGSLAGRAYRAVGKLLKRKSA